jgi:YVTN family beta-propeller protein
MLTAGHRHTCAKVGANAKCWGGGASGQLGNNTFTEALTASVAVLDSVGPPVSMGNVVALEAGANHTCAALATGGVKCWGLNANGQLGDATTNNAALTRTVRGISDAGVVSLSAGNEHTCAVTAAGGARCWGANGEGRLGDTTTTQRTSPADALLGSQTLVFNSPAALKYVTNVALDATALSGLAAEFDSWTPTTCTVTGTTVNPIELGLCGLRAKQAGDGSFRHAPQQLRVLVVGKADQDLAITAIADQTLNDAPVTITLSQGPGGSGNPVVFSSLTPATCSVTGTQMTTVASGTCTLAADQAGTTHYNAGHAETSFQIFKDDQAITFGTAPTPSYAPGGQFTVSASANPSGLAVAFTVPTTTSVCAIASGGTLDILSAGTCTVEANQPGDANYNPAPAVTQDVVIAKAGQPIAFDAVGAKTFGDAPFDVTAANTAHNSGNPITLSTASAACSVAGIQVTILAAGSCLIEADQAGTANYDAGHAELVIDIAQASQAITGFANPGTKTFGDAPFDVSAGVSGGASGNPVVFDVPTTTAVCSVTTGGTVTILGAGSCGVRAQQAGNANYLAAPAVTQTFTVIKAGQAIAGFVNPGPKTFNDAPFSVAGGVTGGASGNPVTFDVPTTTAVCSVTTGGTVTILAAGNCGVRAQQAGNDNYDPAPPLTETFTVAKDDQTITGFAAIADRKRIDPPFGISASATSGLTVSFTVQPASASVCSLSGTTVTIIGTGSCAIDADQAGDGNYDPAPKVTRSFTVNASEPAQPVITSATPGANRATVAFTIASDGGAAITSFSVSCSPAGSASGPASPIEVTGLANGTPHSCTVTAHNSLGASLASAPANVVPSSGPYAYVADTAANLVRIVEVASDAVLGSIPVGAGPLSVVVAPNAQRAYVANFDSDTVSVIDVTTNLVIATIPVGDGPTGLAVRRDGARVYVTNRNANTLSVIDTSAQSVMATIFLGLNAAPVGVAVRPDGAFAVAANSGTNNLSVINTSSNTLDATIGPLGYSPQGLAYAPDGGKLFVTAATASIDVRHGVTGASLATIPLGSPAGSIAARHDSARVYAGHDAGAALTVIDAAANSVVTTVPMGGNVTGVSVSPDNAEVYVVLGSTGEAKLVDTATNAVSATISGLGQASAFSSGFITPILPGAPTGASATGGNGQASVAFTAPALTGGSAILSYTATCDPGGFNANAAQSPVTVTGLANGTVYSCSVRATNAVGTGPASNSASVTPANVPAFTSASSVSFTVNAAATPFTVTATGTPAPTLSLTGGTLPTGVTFVPATGVLSGTPALGTVGTYPLTFSATNVGGTTNQNFTLTVAKTTQSITFGPLADRNFGDAPPALGASASSGLAVAFSSLTSSVCTVNAGAVTILTAGTCNIAANQAGNADYNAAPQVTQDFFVAAVAPGAPTIGTATSGNGQATIAFTPPASNGGAPITSYRATCNPGGINNTGAGSPITVTGLTNGVTYTCSVRATNSSGFTGQASGTVTVTPVVAQLSVNPASVDFGGQSMGTSRTLPVTVTNTGTTTLNVASVSLSGASFAQTNNCTTMAPNASCTINVTFAAAIAGGPLNSQVTAAGSITITSNSPGSPHAVPLAGTAEKSLVSHYYRSILRRDADAGGKAFWQSEASRLQSIGANVNEAWFAMAQFFYFSAEYAAFARTHPEFVTDLYNTFFNRVPDAGGLNFWVGQINSGMPREVILAAFMFSAEFNTFTQAIFGNTAARAEIDVVMDFYRGLLARTPDQGGFDHWVGQFRVAQCAGAGAVYAQVESISASFADGPEYGAKGRTNAQYVGDLYNSILRRGGDLQGVSFWIGQLDAATMSRTQVRQTFIASAEFQGRVTAIVNQGCIPP